MAYSPTTWVDNTTPANAANMNKIEAELVLLDARSGGTTAITQAAHGFTVGNILYLVAGVYTKAKADSAVNAEVVGIVSAVADANNFTLLTGGRITGLTGLTAGTVYFLDPTTAGALTATEPTTANQVSKPLLIADSTTSGYFFNFRGQVAQPASAQSPLVTTLPASPSDGQLVTLVDSLTVPTYSWMLQWSAGAAKWLFIGGPPAVSEIATAESYSLASYGDMATVGPSFTVPRAGQYVLFFGAWVNADINASVQHNVSPKLGAAATSDVDSAFTNMSGGAINQVFRQGHVRTIKRTLAASDLVKLQYKNTPAAARSWQDRWLHVTPVYLT